MATVFEPPQPPELPQQPGAPEQPRPDDEHPRWPWYAPFVVGMGIYLGLGLVVAVVATAADWNELPDRFTLGATLVQDILLVALAVAVAAASGPRALHHLGLRRTGPGSGLLWAFGIFVAFFAFLIIWQQALGIEESDDLAVELGAEESTVNLIAVTVLVCLFAPIAEELFFRGFMFGGLVKPIGWIGAALATGVVFGLVHAGGTDPVFLVPLAVLGTLLCVLYRRTGSLLPGMGLHAFNNALALGVTLGWEPWQTATALVVAPLVVVSLAAAAVSGRRSSASEPPAPAAGLPG